MQGNESLIFIFHPIKLLGLHIISCHSLGKRRSTASLVEYLKHLALQGPKNALSVRYLVTLRSDNVLVRLIMDARYVKGLAVRRQLVGSNCIRV